MAPCFSRKLSLLYFPVPKNAGTSIRACLFEIDNGFPYRNMVINGNVVELWQLFGPPSPFAPVTAPGAIRIAAVRDPWKRLISVYRNRVVFYRETNRTMLARHKVRAELPDNPSFRTFVENLSEYRKIPAIEHHSNTQVHFLGTDPAYYDRLFNVEQLADLEAFFSARAGRPVVLPRLREDGPVMAEAEVDAPDLRRLVAERYEADYRFLDGIAQR